MVSNLLLLSAMTGFVLLIRWYIKVDVLKQFSMHEGLFGIRRPPGAETGDDGEGEGEGKARTDRKSRLRGRRGAAGMTPGGRPRPR